jgi:hypothetical protein
MGNQNFFNQNVDEAAEEYVDEQFPEQTEEAVEQSNQRQVIISEAVRRIEHAKLYETLLNNSLFTPGSADPALISEVEGELKQFIMTRLEVLLGMKSEQSVAVSAKSPFDDDEIGALKQLAGHLLKRNALVSANPTLNPVSAPQQASPIQQATVRSPQIRTVGAAPAGQQRPVQRPAGVAPQKKAAPRKKTANVSAYNGQEYSQARPTAQENPHIPQPAPMPPQAMIDQINATQVSRQSRSMGTSPGMGKLLEAAISLAQNQNAGIKE